MRPHHHAPLSAPGADAAPEPVRRRPPEDMRRSGATPVSASTKIRHLQGMVGNRAVTHLVAHAAEARAVQRSGAVIVQRDVDSAAQELFRDDKVKVIKPMHLKGDFAKRHQIGLRDKNAIQERLDELRFPTLSDEVNRAARVLRAENKNEATGRDAARLGLKSDDLYDLQMSMAALRKEDVAAKNRDAGLKFVSSLDAGESSGVFLKEADVHAHLDQAQNKHQPPGHPIGKRETHGGNKFRIMYASEAWHKANTLRHMVEWARGIEGLEEGVKVQHGQGAAVNSIHYEGFCILSGEIRYVLFHCYPANGSDFLAK